MERLYIDVFHKILWDLRIDYHNNVIPVMQMLLQDQCTTAATQILENLDEHPENIALINILIEHRRFIQRQYWRPYFLLGDKKRSARLALMREDYNHWLLAETMWKGLLRALQEDFVIPLPGHTTEPTNLLVEPVYKPLWGMWQAYNLLGRETATSSNAKEAINIHPFESLKRYQKQQKLAD